MTASVESNNIKWRLYFISFSLIFQIIHFIFYKSIDLQQIGNIFKSWFFTTESLRSTRLDYIEKFYIKMILII